MSLEELDRANLVAILDEPYPYLDNPASYHQDAALPYGELAQYFSESIHKLTLIADIINIYDPQENTQENNDTLGAMTYAELVTLTDTYKNPPEE